MDCLSPHLVQAFPSAVVAISCGAAHSLALCATGEVLTWGCGLHGETALDMAVVYATTPQLVPLLSVLQEKESVTRVKAGGHRSVLVTSANRVLSWGESDHQRPKVLLSTLKPSECVTDLAVESDCLWVVSDTEPSTLATRVVSRPHSPSNTTRSRRRVRGRWSGGCGFSSSPVGRCNNDNWCGIGATCWSSRVWCCARITP